eukprot:CFRG4550T1
MPEHALQTTCSHQNQSTDFSDVKKLKVFQIAEIDAGKDSKKRFVAMFSACRLPQHDSVDHDKVLRYIMAELDNIAGQEYILLYFHTGMLPTHRPPIEWFFRTWETMNASHKKAMQKAYIVHPTFWMKIVMGIARTFLSTKGWEKIEYIERLEDLCDQFSFDDVEIPALVKHYNRTRNLDYQGDRIGVYTQFGVPLADTVDDSCPIPVIMTTTASTVRSFGLQTEGIFRTSGSVKEVNAYKAKFNRGLTVSFTENQAVLAASLYKTFLRDLPEPLIPNKAFESILALQGLDDAKYHTAVQCIVAQLPDINKRILEHIVTLVQNVAECSKENKMTESNLAIVFAPNLGGPKNMLEKLTALPHLTKFTKELFSNPSLFQANTR